jgi:flagellar basal body-associated protein FliL
MLGLATAPLVIGVFGTRRWGGSAFKPPGFVTLDRVVSTLDDEGRLQLKLAIETPDEDSAQVIGHYAPKLRSMMFLTAEDFTAKELRTSEGRMDLADTLLEVFKQNVDGNRSELILAVHFLEFLIGD